MQRAKLSKEARVFDKVRAFPREALCRAQADCEVTRAVATPDQEKLFCKLAAKADELRLDITDDLLDEAEAKALQCELKQLVGYLAELRQVSYNLSDSQCASVRSVGQLCLGEAQLTTAQDVLAAVRAVDGAQLQRADYFKQQELTATATRSQEALVTLAGQIAMVTSQPAAGPRPGAPSARGRNSGICYRWDGTPGSCDRGASCPWPHPALISRPPRRVGTPAGGEPGGAGKGL